MPRKAKFSSNKHLRSWEQQKSRITKNQDVCEELSVPSTSAKIGQGNIAQQIGYLKL